jgi:hypothetical protein
LPKQQLTLNRGGIYGFKALQIGIGDEKLQGRWEESWKAVEIQVKSEIEEDLVGLGYERGTLYRSLGFKRVQGGTD